MGAGSACGAEEGAGSACRFQAHLPHPRRVEPAFMPRIKARRFLWEVGTSYNERRFLWGVVHFE